MNRDPLLDFTDQVVLVTGAASGFGALLAREIGVRGARLVLGDINEAALAELKEELSGADVDVCAQRCDVSVEPDCAALAELAQTRFGRLDIAVNNAGIAPPMVALEETSEEEMDRQYRINVKGVLFGLKYQLPLMKQQGGGTVLNVSSMAGLGGAPKIASYSAAKHAVIGLTKTAAVENAKHNVRVNAICPFYALTPMVTGGDEIPGVSKEDFQAFLASGTPIKRLAEAHEVVVAMLMLLSPKMTYVTGQALAVDGGLSAF